MAGTRKHKRSPFEVFEGHVEIYFDRRKGPILLSLEDIDLVNHSWSSAGGYPGRSITLENGTRTIRRLHHDVAYRLWTGPFTLEHPVEHLDHNKLNARRDNLLWSTPTLNAHRSSEGSYAQRKSGKYQIRISFKCNDIYLGQCNTESQASIVAKYARDYLLELATDNPNLTLDEVKRKFLGSIQAIQDLINRNPT